MSKIYEAITPELRAWVAQQHMFFVSTAPLAANGLVNCSPKGMDSFRVLGPHEVAYLDLTGSGVETIAHLRENGRIVFMFCAFAGPPKIVRFHGRGEVVTPDAAAWPTLRAHFPDLPGARAVIRAQIARVSDSCGFAVPRLDFVEDRDTLARYHQSKGDAGLRDYRNEVNLHSLDGLPALEPQR